MSGGMSNDWTHNENVGPERDKLFLYALASNGLSKNVVTCSSSGHVGHKPHAATENKAQPHSRQAELLPEPVEHHEELHWQRPVQDTHAGRWMKKAKHTATNRLKHSVFNWSYEDPSFSR